MPKPERVIVPLGDYHKGERFLLTKNDQPIAELAPAAGSRRATWGALKFAVAQLPHDSAFAGDLEKVNQADQPSENPWA